MAILVNKRPQDAMEKRSSVVNAPMTSGQAAGARGQFTAPRTNATQVVRGIFDKNVGELAGKSKALVNENVSQQGNKAIAGVKQQEETQSQPLKDEVAKFSDQPGWSKQVEQGLGGGQGSISSVKGILGTGMTQQTGMIEGGGIDPLAATKAASINPTRNYSPGMSLIDSLAFKKEGGDQFTTKGINEQGRLIDAQETTSSANVAQLTNQRNKSLQDLQSFINKAVISAKKGVEQKGQQGLESARKTQASEFDQLMKEAAKLRDQGFNQGEIDAIINDAAKMPEVSGSWQDFIADTDAARYNNALQILGQGGGVTAGNKGPASYLDFLERLATLTPMQKAQAAQPPTPTEQGQASTSGAWERAGDRVIPEAPTFAPSAPYLSPDTNGRPPFNNQMMPYADAPANITRTTTTPNVYTNYVPGLQNLMVDVEKPSRGGSSGGRDYTDRSIGGAGNRRRD
jgi:hypothetical protein